VRGSRIPIDRGDRLIRLRYAAILAFTAHLVAGLAMVFVLRHGLETTADLHARLEFLLNHRVAWTLAWLTWTVAAPAILYFYVAYADAHRISSRVPIYLTVVAIACDLSAQAIEIGVLPSLVAHEELFLGFHRAAVMLSGYLANGLYSITAMYLTFAARSAYPPWVSTAGIAVGVFGISLSLAALADSAAGLFWTNVFLLPSILVWLAGSGFQEV